MAAFTVGTALLATDSDHAEASRKIQLNLNEIESWLKNWKIKNEAKSQHITFIVRQK